MLNPPPRQQANLPLGGSRPFHRMQYRGEPKALKYTSLHRDGLADLVPDFSTTSHDSRVVPNLTAQSLQACILPLSPPL
jgi:hypothetical protein